MEAPGGLGEGERTQNAFKGVQPLPSDSVQATRTHMMHESCRSDTGDAKNQVKATLQKGNGCRIY